MIFLKILNDEKIVEKKFTIKKSKFITYISKVKNKEELDKFIMSHSDKSATHNCYAYRYGDNKLTYGYNNDGEPNGTAGEPLLKLIETNELTNIVIFVTRYYGGIKLGTGGLQKAYSAMAIESLKETTFKQLELLYNVDISFNISDIKTVYSFLKNIATEITYDYIDDLVYANLKLEQLEKLDPIKSKLEIIKKEQGYY
ncbi:YigZ family protein [Spiroplasma sp. BIUS-1]|uniref:IMPACT family protein n=1 Tax=Spiroplasma sp. BIUS-1 TaxID=216964 RepID=UPI001398E2F0|nr:YigZ family protein [Spiroplasma sp. BIUS-1]QHX36310.1 YigZ family protein [Spiroplasma sp. BIUS-1]